MDYTFLSSVWRKCSSIDYMLGSKLSLSNFKKIEIISSIFSHYKGMKLEISKRRNFGKFTNMWKLNNVLNGKDQRRNGNFKVSWDKWKWKHNTSKVMGYNKNRFKG
jgi:hypothetical protein